MATPVKTNEQKYEELLVILNKVWEVLNLTWQGWEGDTFYLEDLHASNVKTLTLCQEEMNKIKPTNFGEDTNQPALRWCRGECQRITYNSWGMVNHWRCIRCNERN